MIHMVPIISLPINKNDESIRHIHTNINSLYALNCFTISFMYYILYFMARIKIFHYLFDVICNEDSQFNNVIDINDLQVILDDKFQLLKSKINTSNHINRN